ncbi:Methyltransferase domain-containing protein [Billgrantia gudaonensis]|uniref:Methyltransferase domain-containing protein n=2 Tax=Billgrantia gudaonensis TaxID=376427 RepID=A0A1G8NJW8_9GAMM|nr:Methyltransferase domain-containing protein [Halomonas gudaonensis]
MPGLAAMLRALDETALTRLQDAPFEHSPLAAWLPVEELAALVDLPAISADSVEPPSAWSAHIGGRKWQQIVAFAARMPVAADRPLIEWCAGKGHLARTLSRLHGCHVTALEWQASLCAAGRCLAERQGADVALVGQDVMAGDATRWLGGNGHLAALHACGDLHVRLIELAADHAGAVTLAPCCYHRTAAERYRPLSRYARRLTAERGLALARDDLTLAVQETVTAPRGDRRRRARANAWRLGFDALQREVRGIDAYLPVPSLAHGRLPETFAGFCRWAAEQKGLALPARLDAARFEREGQRRLAEVERLELVRHLFRRPLEVWLALDRRMRLEEAGFAVELGTFCARELTPRNLLLRAEAEPRGKSVGRRGFAPRPGQR